MTLTSVKRNYSLVGPEGEKAQEKGLVSAEWYSSPVPRQRLKELMRRRNGPAIRDTVIWFTSLAIAGYLGIRTWPSWWSVPIFIAYGILYATVADSRWHECCHGTAFKTPWMNEVVYQLASFMILRSATPWRWSHSRHHSDTFIVGRDPEILERPPVWRVLILQFFDLYGGPVEIKRFLLHCIGRVSPTEAEYIPRMEYWKTFWEARCYLSIFLIVIGLCLYYRTLLPILLVGLPTFYGVFLDYLFAITQHLGLYEDVLDHRLNSRTYYLNPISRFLYWNMNFHVEHHMFPLVPYHGLPALHQEMRADTPKPCSSLWAALKEVFVALIKQNKDPGYVVVKPLPSTARPYRFGPYWDNVRGSGSIDDSLL